MLNWLLFGVELDFTVQDKKNIRPTFSVEHIYGGALLAMCSNDFVCFYDWVECRLIRRIDVNVKVCSNTTRNLFHYQTSDFGHTGNNVVFSFDFVNCSRIFIGLIAVIWWQFLVIHHFTF